MHDKNFKNLIIDAYNKSKEGYLIGTIYETKDGTVQFSDITDINEFIKNNNLNKLLLSLKSKILDTIVDVYGWELDYYDIDNERNLIYVQPKHGEGADLMYNL